MKRRFFIGAALLLVLVICIYGGDKPAKKLSLDLYFEMESVSNPQISPDGREIVYARRWTDKTNDKQPTELWIMNSDGTKNRFLTKGSNPKWSSDGSRIAFTAKGEPGGTQLFVLYKDFNGPATQITRLEKNPSNMTWSPDGQHIAFTMLVPDKNKWPILLPNRPEGAKWTKDPRIVESLVYRRDRIGFLEEGHQHIFVVAASGGTARQITSGDWNHGRGGISWSRDGQEILFSSLRVPDAEYEWRESEIYSVNVQSGAIHKLTDRKGPDSNPVVSPNNKYIAYTGYDWTDDTYIERKLYVMNRDGSHPRVLTDKLDRSPGNLQWAEDNSGIYFNANNFGTRNLYFASLGGKVRQITKGNHMLTVSDINSRGMAVGVMSDYHKSSLLVSLDVKKPVIKTLVDVNEDVLGNVQLGEVEEINYPSVDDYKIQGWVIKPPDFNPEETYPLILVIHGGPHGMYNVGFRFAWQYHVSEGYVVLYTNPRGSSGYGSEFGNAIKNAYPGKDYDDLMKGIDEILRHGYIDPDRLYVYGGSGGGVLTSWIVGHTHRFAAASVNYPVIDWLSFVGTTDGAGWYRNFKKPPWEDPSEHLQRSPLMYVGNVTTPTMLMTGVNDLRTPISQTEEFYQALKFRKIPTAMIRFKDEFHGTSSKPSNFVRTQLYLHHWFEKSQNDSTATSPH